MNNVYDIPAQSTEARAARLGRLGDAAQKVMFGALALGGALAIQGIGNRLENAITNTHHLVSASAGISYAEPTRNNANVVRLGRGALTHDYK